ncbi:MAG: transposase [Proteobacteria bacterium]|nr:transposase [Pseudomonadota bacterium]
MNPRARSHRSAGLAALDSLDRQVDIRPVLRAWDSRLRRFGYVQVSEASLWMLSQGSAPAVRHRMWVRMAGPPGQQIVLFDFQRADSDSKLQHLLQGVAGYLQSNGATCYERVAAELGLVPLGCFNECRVRIRRALQHLPTSLREARSAASGAICLIDALYAVEREAQLLEPRQRVALRKRRARPALARLHDWMSQRLQPGVDVLAQAFNHCLSQWPSLIRYLQDGSVQIDNSAVEAAIGSVSAGHGKWLFAESDRDAANAAALYSLIATATVNKMEPQSYLRWLFNELPAARSDRQSMGE